MNILWRKEWYLQSTPVALWIRLGLWLGFALFFLAAYQEYQALAPQFAQLENRRGATQMLLLPVNQFALNMMLIWAVFFGARALAQEYEWHTLLFASWKLLRMKALVLWVNLWLLLLPFWLCVGYLALATDWDKGLVYGILAAQGLLSIYVVGLVWVLSALLRHSVTTALSATVLLLLLWLAPLLIREPVVLANMLQWFSPFSHIHFLTQGIFHIQTLVFILLHLVFFASCLMLTQQEN